MLNRREFIRNAALLFAAPAIVKVASIMPISVFEADPMNRLRILGWKVMYGTLIQNSGFARRIQEFPEVFYDAVPFNA